jgi:PIN domain nuclease of toxin-antitoxin system
LIVLDTHAWFWWAVGDARLSPVARAALRRERDVRIPAIVCWELLLLAERDRIRLDRPKDLWVRHALSAPTTSLEPLSAEIALQAVGYHAALGGDPVDCMVAATGRVLGAPIVTRDHRIAELPGVRTIW